MRRVFLYEFVTGGGWFRVDPAGPLPDSLLREGRAMVQSLAADLAAIPELRVTLLRDERIPDPSADGCESYIVRSADDEEKSFRDCSSEADGTIVIAPEFDSFLGERSRWVGESGGRLLSPSPSVIEVCADKRRTSEHLAAARLPVPEGVTFDVEPRSPVEAAPPAIPLSFPFPFPVVLKLNDGAGSEGTRRIDSPSEWIAAWNDLQHRAGQSTKASAWRVERFCPGVAASVAVLCGPNGNVSLPPCSQMLSDDGRFQYLGGECPLSESLASRATRLAQRAIATLSNPIGYVGVDLVLGDDPSGTQDVVIEINPRLTTSYVGLRKMVDRNLANAMLDVALGSAVSIGVLSGGVTFYSDGKGERRMNPTA